MPNQSLESDSFFYSYDADGNQTLKVSKETGDSVKMEYDIENRLTSVVKRDTLIEYKYDALGRRMAKVINGKATEFRYDGEDLIMEVVKDAAGNDSITASYTFGPGIDNPLSMTREEMYYYVKDGLGSIRALTDESGNVVQEYQYSVFGQIVTQTGSIENPFTYTAREYDPETGNYYFRARYYDPYAGRFMSEDPLQFLALDLNYYRLTWNNALNFRDPSGLEGEACKATWLERGKELAGKAKNWLKNKALGSMFAKPSSGIDAAQSINANYRMSPEQNEALEQLEAIGAPPAPGTGSADSAKTAQFLDAVGTGLQVIGQ